MKLPNPRSLIPRNSKREKLQKATEAWPAVFCSFEIFSFLWDLGFGIWDFGLGAP